MPPLVPNIIHCDDHDELDRPGFRRNAGVALRDVREAASHAHPRTTMRDDRRRASLDRHDTSYTWPPSSPTDRAEQWTGRRDTERGYRPDPPVPGRWSRSSRTSPNGT